MHLCLGPGDDPPGRVVLSSIGAFVAVETPGAFPIRGHPSRLYLRGYARGVRDQPIGGQSPRASPQFPPARPPRPRRLRRHSRPHRGASVGQGGPPTQDWRDTSPPGDPRFDQRPRQVVAVRFFILLAVALHPACFSREWPSHSVR